MKKLIVAAVLLAVTSPAFAEGPANPANPGNEPAKQEPSTEQMQQIMESSLGAMAPAMGKMAEMMLEAELRVAERPETAKAVAKFKKNLYDELVRQGFTKKEALDMTLNTQIPGAVSGMK